MPATLTQTVAAIPIPNPDNLVQCINAIRNALIAQSNTDAGRSNASGSLSTTGPAPSQFILTSEVIVPVTYTASSGATVTVPQLISLTLTNAVTNETWTWQAPGKLTNGGAVGAAL